MSDADSPWELTPERIRVVLRRMRDATREGAADVLNFERGGLGRAETLRRLQDALARESWNVESRRQLERLIDSLERSEPH